MSRFKRLNSEDINQREVLLYKSQSVTDNDIETYQYQKNSVKTSGLRYIYKSNENRNTEQNVSRHSLWASLNVLFHLSGSPYNDEESKYSNPHFTFAEWTCFGPPPTDLNNLHLHKFHSSSLSSNTHHRGKVYNIPQAKFGEYIKPGTFKLEETGSLTLKDDSFGNLYVNEASSYPDATTSPSSSQNYVGNVFYHSGIAVINEQQFRSYGSPSASMHNMGTEFTMSFSAAKTVYSTEYTVKILPGEFNISTNPTVYFDYSSSTSALINGDLTGSGEFKPYFNQIYFYDNVHKEPLMVASLSQPIQRNHDAPLKIKVKMDW